MILDEFQAKQIIRAPKNNSDILSAKFNESALRVFTEELDEVELRSEPYWTELSKKIKNRSDRKYDRLLDFFRYPLPVVGITDSIMSDYFKVFDGKNKFFSVSSERDISSLKNWISENNPQDWIEEQSKIVLKNRPVSFVVVDRQEDGVPYLINVTSDRLVDAQILDDKGHLGYIAFVHSIVKNHEDPDKTITFYSVYDQQAYWVFSKLANSSEYVLVSRKPHNIGACPAKAFVESQSNSANNFKRRVAFSSSISKLEDWTIFDVFRNYLDHYAPFPVTEAPDRQCPNESCQDGKTQEEEVIDHASGEKRLVWVDCKACSGGKDKGMFIGPGTHIGIKLQADKANEDGSGKFKMHFPDTDKMQYVPEKLDDLELEVRYKTVGINNIMNNEAMNEIQVKGSFASMESILMRNKQDFEALYTWIVRTVSKLFYTNVHIEVEANLGTEFYLVTEEELQERFERAKAMGLPKAEQTLIYEQLVDTKYKSNPSMVERQKMLTLLDPLPLYSETEAISMFEKRVIDEPTLNLKINFQKFISQFELENGSIDQFGELLELRNRIEIIKQTLNQYNDEHLKSKQLPPSEEGTGGLQPDFS